jgi:hypothetical protein
VTHQEAVEMLAASRYLLDDMADADRQKFEDHFFSCDLCADDLRITAAMLQGAREGFAAPSTSGHVLPMAVNVKAPVIKPAWYRSAALPWAAAATLALVTAYQSLWVVPSLRQDSSPLALVPVTLRPASRGVEATIPRGTGPVTLAVEINEPMQGEVTYILSTAAGRQIVSGRAAAPAPGTPLMLLMPSWTLVGPMHYILSVHDAGSSGRSLGEYRFAVPAH